MFLALDQIVHTSHKRLLPVTIMIVMAFVLTACGGPAATTAPAVVDVEPTALPVEPSEPAAEPTEVPPEPTEAPPEPVEDSAEGNTWLVMLYQDADDQVLEKDIVVDLNEAELVGSSDQVIIVSQLDRFIGGYDGDGDWTTTKRFIISQDDDLDTITSEEIDIGEINMADGQSLIDFVTWAVENFPADKYALILSDHGMGWPGGWSDPDPGILGQHDIALAQTLGDALYLMELDDALGQIREQTDIDQFELIGFDACLMGHIEVFSAVAPHARYSVASQETEPALGWAYAAFLGELVDNPGMDGADLATSIVNTYIDMDAKIVIDEVRADFVAESYGITDEISAEDLAIYQGQNITLSAVDLAAMSDVMAALDDFAVALSEIDQGVVAEARTYAQAFESVFGETVPPSYIDLGHFAQVLAQESGDEAVMATADELLFALQQAIIAERHGPERPGASGTSIYFPNSELFGWEAAGIESYTTVANRFANESLWDNFLSFHYTGEPLPELPDTPTRAGPIIGPGASKIELTPLILSSDVASIDEPLLLQTDVTGSQIGFIYIFTGLIDEEENALLIADVDFIDAGETRQVGNVYYPDWGSAGVVELDFEWEPLLYEISDGTNYAFALLDPNTYGASAEESTFTVDGIFTFVSNGMTRDALMYFNGAGQMTSVFGFTGQGGTGAPREILPKPGDQFTVMEEWFDLDENVSDEESTYYLEGGTLTFGTENFFWEAVIAPPGDYIVGIIAEDFDGNSYEEFELVSVVETASSTSQASGFQYH